VSDAKLRRSAEEIFAEELAALKRGDERPRPENWLLSPSAVVTYLLGGTARDGTVISAKYVGNRGTVEASHMAANLVGAVVKDPVQDLVALQEYLENVLRTRDGWDDLYRAIRDVI
jgi:hypothetical protein